MQTEHFRYMQGLDDRLSEMSAEEISRLYLRLFSTEDGQLVLKDLANRCYITDSTIASDAARIAFNEGARSVYLSIQTRLIEAVKGRKKEEEDV